MKVRTLLILFIVAALITISATATLAQTTTTIPMLPGARQQIKVGFGDQTSPHVACNLVSYTNDDFEGNSTIKYFDFATNTEQLNDSTADQLNDLIALVRSFGLHDGTENSLVTKLQDALAALDVSDTASFCDSLTAFANASQAQADKKLTADQVRQLVNFDNGIKSDRDCQ